MPRPASAAQILAGFDMAKSPNFDDQNRPKQPTTRKRIFDYFFDRAFKRTQPQAKPERSYFDPPESDQEKQRRQPSQAQKASDIRVPDAVRKPEPATFGKAQREFESAYGKGLRERQEIQQRYQSERA